VAVGNDFDLSYERLTAAARAAARGAAARDTERGSAFADRGRRLSAGCGSIVQSVAVAAGVQPIVVGKPEPPLFRMALERLGLTAATTAMVGDSIPSDIKGARAVGMPTVLYAPAVARRPARPT